MGRKHSSVDIGNLYPYNPENPQTGLRPSPAEAMWNRAAIRRYLRNKTPPSQWRLILAPGHNPWDNGKSPAIMAVRKDGQLRGIDETMRYEEAMAEGLVHSPFYRRKIDIENRWLNPGVKDWASLRSTNIDDDEPRSRPETTDLIGPIKAGSITKVLNFPEGMADEVDAIVADRGEYRPRGPPPSPSSEHLYGEDQRSPSTEGRRRRSRSRRTSGASARLLRPKKTASSTRRPGILEPPPAPSPIPIQDGHINGYDDAVDGGDDQSARSTDAHDATTPDDAPRSKKKTHRGRRRPKTRR